MIEVRSMSSAILFCVSLANVNTIYDRERFGNRSELHNSSRPKNIVTSLTLLESQSCCVEKTTRTHHKSVPPKNPEDNG